MKRLLIFGLLVMTLLLSGCFLFESVDTENAKVEFKHTIKLPAGFSVVSTVPLNMTALKQGVKNPEKFWEGDSFAIEANIRNDNTRRENTRVEFYYDKSHIANIYLFMKDGSPFRHIEGDLYEFSKETLPSSESPIYVAGKTAIIKENYEYVPIEFKISFMTSDNQLIKANSYKILVYNKDYQPPANSTEQ